MIEVYDHTKPAPTIEMPTVEVMSRGDRVFTSRVRPTDSAEYGVDVLKELRPSTRDVGAGLSVEHD